MTDKNIIRRSLSLPAARRADLATIRLATGIRNDTAAINEAIKIRAAFADRTLTDIQRALGFYDSIKGLSHPSDKLVVVDRNVELTPEQRMHATILIPVPILG